MVCSKAQMNYLISLYFLYFPFITFTKFRILFSTVNPSSNMENILDSHRVIPFFLMFTREHTRFLAQNEFFDENYRLSSIFRP